MSEEKKYDPCGGCGADHPSQQCIGCRHPFREITSRPIPEGVTAPVLGWCQNCGEILKMENKPSISPFGFFEAHHCEVARLNNNPNQISTSAVDPKDALIRELVASLGDMLKWSERPPRNLPTLNAMWSKAESTLTLARTTCPEAFDGCNETPADGR